MKNSASEGESQQRLKKLCREAREIRERYERLVAELTELARFLKGRPGRENPALRPEDAPALINSLELGESEPPLIDDSPAKAERIICYFLESRHSS